MSAFQKAKNMSEQGSQARLSDTRAPKELDAGKMLANSRVGGEVRLGPSS
jgi:hypothetical protein